MFDEKNSEKAQHTQVGEHFSRNFFRQKGAIYGRFDLVLNSYKIWYGYIFAHIQLNCHLAGKSMLRLEIIISEQKLLVIDADQQISCYSISSGKKGLGEQKGSEQTPRGWHYIRAKIGEGLPINTVFKARRPTGEIFCPELAQQFPDRDWILTRILWLCGLEVGKNRLGGLDTMQRFIYIHGCPDDFPMGAPLSHGCIRMRNLDIVQLFDLVEAKTRVLIRE